LREGNDLNLVGKTKIVEFCNVPNEFHQNIQLLVNRIEFVANAMGVDGGEK
jgi:hypothetical protein